MVLFYVFVVIGILGKQSSNAKEINWKSYQKEFEVDVPQDDPQFKALGCFRDQRHQRALRSRYMRVNSAKTSKEITIECARGAVARSFVFFGVQSGGECWGDKEGHSRYDTYGKTNDCQNGVGSSLSNSVYEIVKADGYCVADFKLIPYKSAVKKDPCQTCACQSDGHFVCQDKTCPPLPHKCERIVNAPGECCPFCDCYFKGNLQKEGVKWFWPINDKGCDQCSCIKGQALCTMEVCPTCSVYISKPGMCCRACASEPGFTVKPTGNPVLTLPLPPHGFGPL